MIVTATSDGKDDVLSERIVILIRIKGFKEMWFQIVVTLLWGSI
jgi:hypothetical protein